MGGFIPWRKIDLWLAGMRTIWISTTRPDGRPHATPVWFVWTDRSVFFVTGRRTQKARNLTHESFVIAHAGDGDDAIILEGQSTIVTEQGELQRIDALYREKYVDPNSGAQATIFNPDDDLYRVRIRHAMAWEYANVANRTDWYFDT